jgi:Na+-driven multidrug efflux pump
VLGCQAVLTNLCDLTYCTHTAFAGAPANFVGKELGAKDPECAKVSGYFVTFIATSYNALLALVLVVFRGSIVGLFTEAEDIKQVATAAMPLLSIYILVDTFQLVLLGF